MWTCWRFTVPLVQSSWAQRNKKRQIFLKYEKSEANVKESNKEGWMLPDKRDPEHHINFKKWHLTHYGGLFIYRSHPISSGWNEMESSTHCRSEINNTPFDIPKSSIKEISRARNIHERIMQGRWSENLVTQLELITHPKNRAIWLGSFLHSY